MKENSKERIIRLFQFLKQYNNIKNPIITDISNQPWKKWMDNLPKHKTVLNNIYCQQQDEKACEGILRVKRPVLTACPTLPIELRQWVEVGWDHINGDVKVKAEIKVRKEASYKDEIEYTVVKFEEDRERVKVFNHWKAQREAWVKEEQPARAADDLFNTLYGLYSTIMREPEAVELILGDAFLLYKKDVFIDHPLLLQHVKLEFDADIPEFILRHSDKGTEIYRSLFYYIEDLNSELLRELYDEFDINKYSVLEQANTNSFLNRLANALSAKGQFHEFRMDVSNNYENPQIYRRPVLFLRKRNIGFGTALDSVLEDINTAGKLPGFLKDVVGCTEERHYTEEAFKTMGSLNPNGIDEDILMTKPANSEQLAVAKYLEYNDAVLVQGPPGTGKTHTIANMIGHLLAQGKSILVTSYSEKALSVLKSKVADNLQALCLSLLSTTESREEMEKTLDEINENRSRLNPATLIWQIEALERVRREQISRLRNLQLKLKDARLNEYRPIVINGEEFKPIEAAKFLSKYKDTYSWIPTPVKGGEGTSLTEAEILELYGSDILISAEEEREYHNDLPELEELMSPTDFYKLITKKNSYREEELKSYEDCWHPVRREASIEALQVVIKDINAALEKLQTENEWMLAAMEGSREDAVRKNWEGLIREIDKVYKMNLVISEELIKYNPEIQQVDSKIDVEKLLEAIIEKLEASGKVSRLNLILNPDMKTVINSCRINGKVPKHLNEYRALLKYYRLSKARMQLANRWDRQMAPLGADRTYAMGVDFEIVCHKYRGLLEEALLWYEKYWNPIISKLKSLGVDLIRVDKNIDLSKDKYSRLKYIKQELGPKLIAVINSEIYRLEYSKYVNLKEGIERKVNTYSQAQTSKIISSLQTALHMESVALYKEAYEALANLKKKGQDIDRRKYLLRKLSDTAPAWAKEIALRNPPHGEGNPPTAIKEAWLYAQFSQELIERDSQYIESIQEEILKIEEELKENTAELAFKKAWQAKLLNFQDNRKQVQAIEGWRQLIRKIGTGTGKKVEVYKAEARKLMPECQGAIPVWIMPLSKVVENFNPRQNKFDVVIIDEASQADLMGLVALYLGKKAIVVGDNEQVSPLAVGERSEDVDKLIKEYLYDIPNDKLYSGKFSIYDLAQASGYQPVRLREHFRCVPEIIQYSNWLSYNGAIKPLRDSSEVVIKPATVTYRVHGATCRNKMNKKEAETIVSLILACCESEEYKDKTFGVITLRGEKQAALIDTMLQNRMEPSEYKKRQILCGKSANFQGDERDIIFLSMVDTNESEGLLNLMKYGNDDLYKKRYNVAVSRARDQIWLVHSIGDDDLKPGDIRKELMEYLKNPTSKEIIFDTLSKAAESEFEVDVMKFLIGRGYSIKPQWSVGSYRIDMVAIYKDKKVAIECDGERWHGEDKLEEDMVRQAILERLGWRFIRIRGSEFYRNKLSTMERVCERLTAMEIYPCNGDLDIENARDFSLVEKVKSIAQSIRNEWKEEK
ncbi:AAA domain-containing protein [Clostridium thermarum]|uniref:AAA domain-containing protein n=1 Tax=Clostridium thermarum TaxID=1716543 RepID=UPI00111D5F49|nr:AAA domain-containing protein [Clostridium thermarum]